MVSVPLPEVVALGSASKVGFETAEEFERELEVALKDDSPDAIETSPRRLPKPTRGNSVFKCLSLRWSLETLPSALRSSSSRTTICELNRLCLEKLYEQTEWPNFEVIVIDNASADGTREYSARSRTPLTQYLRVVLNDTNLGFAAANNIGLRMASGELSGFAQQRHCGGARVVVGSVATSARQSLKSD
jgi:hypothetical protein